MTIDLTFEKSSIASRVTTAIACTPVLSISPVCGEHASHRGYRCRYVSSVWRTLSPVCGEHDICSKTQGHRGYRVFSSALHFSNVWRSRDGEHFLQFVERTRVNAAIAGDMSPVCGEHVLQCVENTSSLDCGEHLINACSPSSPHRTSI